MSQYTLSEYDCQSRLIYSMLVAGKTAVMVNAIMERFHSTRVCNSLPFDRIKRWDKAGMLGKKLRELRTGNYSKMEKGLRQLVNTKIDLWTVTPEDLEKIHGIGPKTSRFFIMWIRPKERYAALDVHILRWLRARDHDAPLSTPPYPRYSQLEAIFIAEADAMGKTPRELDYEIWEAGSKGRNVA